MKDIFKPPFIILLNFLAISKIPAIFTLSCLKVCKALQRTEVDLSPNRYQQFITSQLQSINQVDTEKFLIKGKDTILGNCKYDLNNLSYRNYLYSGYGYGLDYLLENAVYLCLKRAGYQVYVGIIKDAEVDFVAMKGDKKLYLQVILQLIEE